MNHKPGSVRTASLRSIANRIVAAAAVCLTLALLAGATTTGTLPARLLAAAGLVAPSPKAPAPPAPWREAGGRTVVTAAGRGAPWVSLRDGVELVAEYDGDLGAALKSGETRALAAASADFDGDGVADLAAAHATAGGGAVAIHRGNVDAIYPNAPEAQARRAEGSFTDAPFLSPARVFAAPVAPDFAAAGDFDADGRMDLIVGARGGDALYVLPGDGAGGLGAPRRVALPGALTALAAGDVNRRDGLADVVAGVAAGSGARLLVFEHRRGAFAGEPESIAVAGRVADVAIGDFAGDGSRDVAAAAGAELALVYGRDRSREETGPKVESRPLPSPAVALAAGDFSGDGRLEVAALTAAGEVLALREPADAGKRLKNWKKRTMASGLAAEGARLVVAGVSSRIGDDLLVVDAAGSALRVVEGGEAARAEAAAPASLDVAGAPAAVVPMRLNADGLDDLVVIGRASSQPVIVETTPRGGFVVTTLSASGPGSLADAIAQANMSPGADLITFAIDQTGPYIIQPSPAGLPGIGEAVTIDATTQPGFSGSPVVEVRGFAGSSFGLVVQMPASDVVIRGLSITGWGGSGVRVFSETSATTVEGCWIGLKLDGFALANATSGVELGFSSNNLVGGTTSAARNVISGNGGQGVRVDGGVSNRVEGNYIGTSTDGTFAIGNAFNGVEVANAFDATVGGFVAGTRNVISGNGAGGELSNGVYVHGEADSTAVAGNTIGLAADGSTYLGNGANGVLVQAAFTLVDGNVISGNAANGVRIDGVFAADVYNNVIGLDETVSFDRRNGLSGVEVVSSSSIFIGHFEGGENVISRNLQQGIRVADFADCYIYNNLIGTDFTATEFLGNFGDGVVVDNAFAEIASNLIYFNGGVGVKVVNDGYAPTLDNFIRENVGLGIDLGGDGVTPNDTDDADAGPNDLINFPVVTSAVSDGGTTLVDGTYSGPPLSDILVQFFVSDACDASGSGEGEVLASTIFLSTDGAGQASFTGVALEAPASPGQVVTATATLMEPFKAGNKREASGNRRDTAGKRGSLTPVATSEFSPCTAVVAPGADIVATNMASVSSARRGDTFTYTVTVTNDGPSPASVVTFSSDLPSNVEFVSIMAPPSWTVMTPPVGGTGVVAGSTPSLAPGASASFLIDVRVAASAAGGEQLDNIVNADASEFDADESNNTALVASVLVETEAEIAVSKTAGSPTVLPGEEITYTITVENTGFDPATEVLLEDVLPTTTVFRSATVPAGWTLAEAPAVDTNGTVRWSKSSVAGGESASFTLVVRVSPDVVGSQTIQNVVTVAGSGDVSPDNNQDAADVTIPVQIDAAVAQVDAPDPVVAGQTIAYTISVSFNGPDFANSATLTGATPANTTFESLMVPEGWFVDQTPPVGGTGAISAFRSLSKGGARKAPVVTEEITLTLRVNPGTPGGTVISNMVSVSTPEIDPAPGNNSSTATTTVEAQADLVLTESAAPAAIPAGQDLTFTLMIANEGPDPAPNVTVDVAMPGVTTFQSATAPPGWSATTPPVGGAGAITFQAPSLAPGAGATLTYVVRVPPGTPEGTELFDSASASSDAVDPNPKNNSAEGGATVAPTADLAVAQTDAPDPVLAGQDVTYTITLANNGPDFPLSVMLSGATPANTTFQSLSAPPGWTVVAPPVGGTGAYSAELVTSARPRGGADVFTLVVRVDPGTPGGTTITNTVTVASPTFDPVASNNTSAEMTAVAGMADLSVTIVPTPDTAVGGQTVSYLVTVTNAGPDPAAGVTLAIDSVETETPPTFESLATPAAWTAMTPPVGGSGPVTATTPSLGPGASAVFTLVKRLQPGTPGGAILVESASVSSATTDPDASDNGAAAQVFVARQVDVAVAMTDAPDPVFPGDDITYTITLATNGPDQAFALSLAGATPANTTFQSFSAPAGWEVATPPVGGTGQVLASLEEGEVRGEAAAFTLVVRVDPGTPAGTTITNAVTGSSPEIDPDPSNNTAMATTGLGDQADLAVAKSASAETALPGGELTYTISVTNNGPDAAASVTLQESVPEGTTFVSASAPAGWTCSTPPAGGTGPIVCSAGGLASGATAGFTVVVRVDEFLPSSSVIVNTASVDAATTDPVASNDSATVTTFVGAPPSANVSLTMSAEPSQATPGSTVTYSLVATNNGPNDAVDLRISDPLPAGTTFVSASASAGASVTSPAAGGSGSVVATWPGVTPAGATRSLTIVARVDPSATPSTTITNRATASSGALDANFDDNTAEASTLVVPDESVPSADLSLSLGAVPPVVDTGTFVTYDVTVSNGGPDSAEQVRVSGTTPAGTRIVSVSAAGGSCTAPAPGQTGDFECVFSTLEAGQSATVSVVLNFVAEGGETVSAQFVVSSETDDPTPQNNTAAASTGVQAGDDVLLMWDPPLPSDGGALNPPLHLQSFPVEDSEKRFTGRLPGLLKQGGVVGYKIYRSNMPTDGARPENFFTSVPPNQTSIVVPTAPGGSFFTVTALYPNGESGGSNDASGGLPQPEITSVRLKGNKLVVSGKNFTDRVTVFVDGIPFTKQGKVKQAKGRIQQKGRLLIGMPVRQYLELQGGVILVSVLNADEGIGTFLYRP